MTLLTPKEMYEATDAEYDTVGLTKLCQAQDAKTRKAIIEWADGECPHRKVLHYRRQCPICWQAVQEGEVP